MAVVAGSVKPPMPSGWVSRLHGGGRGALEAWVARRGVLIGTPIFVTMSFASYLRAVLRPTQVVLLG